MKRLLSEIIEHNGGLGIWQSHTALKVHLCFGGLAYCFHFAPIASRYS